MKSNQSQVDSNQKKNKDLKWWIGIIMDILVFGLLLYYMIHINFGIGMKKINIDIKTDCQGNIYQVNNIPYNNYTEYNLTNIQKTIYQTMNKTQRG